MVDALTGFETAPARVQLAVAETIQWKQFHDRGHARPTTAEMVAQMFLAYLIYAGGTVAEFDWLLSNDLLGVNDYELFLDFGNDLVHLKIITLT